MYSLSPVTLMTASAVTCDIAGTGPQGIGHICVFRYIEFASAGQRLELKIGLTGAPTATMGRLIFTLHSKGWPLPLAFHQRRVN